MNLDALDEAINETAPRTSGIQNGTSDLYLSEVYPNPDQPRKHFDHVSLAELAESIRDKGLMQPIVVARKSDGYMIIAGERRWRAHKLNASITIRAIVTDRDDLSIEEMALIENIQRDDLTDYEIAMAVVRLWESGMYEQKQDLARAISKPRSYLSKAFGLLNLDPEIKTDIEENKSDIGLSVLQELSRVEPGQQREVYDRYKAGEITRDEFKEAAKSEPKVSRGKIAYSTNSVSHIVDGEVLSKALIREPIFDTCEIGKTYKITIEEIE